MRDWPACCAGKESWSILSVHCWRYSYTTLLFPVRPVVRWGTPCSASAVSCWWESWWGPCPVIYSACCCAITCYLNTCTTLAPWAWCLRYLWFRTWSIPNPVCWRLPFWVCGWPIWRTSVFRTSCPSRRVSACCLSPGCLSFWRHDWTWTPYSNSDGRLCMCFSPSSSSPDR